MKLYAAIAAFVIAVIFVLAVVAARYGDGRADDREQAMAYCKDELVPALLNKPSGFYSGVNAVDFDIFHPEGVRVTGSVDTYNKFDVPVRMNFGCTVHRNGEKWRVNELWIEPAVR